jgi:ferredoxin
VCNAFLEYAFAGIGRDRGEKGAMKVVVDFDTCQSNAICMGICPEVFEVREDGFLYVLDEHPPESLRAKVEEAAQLCPTQSITIEED